MNIGKRVVEIVIKAKDDSSGAFKSLKSNVDALTERVPVLSNVMGVLKNPITAVTAALAAVTTAMVASYNAAKRYGEALDDMTKRTGQSAEAMSEWSYLAELNGASLGDVETSMRKLRQTMADAISGNQQAIDTFRTLGVSATDADGKMRSLTDVMLEIGQAVRKYGVESLQGAAAQDALGRSSSALMGVISQGTDELTAQRREFQRLGGQISSEFVRSADEAGDAAHRLNTAVMGLAARTTQPVNWAIALGKDLIAGVVGDINGYLDSIGQKLGKGFTIFVDSGGARAQDAQRWADSEAKDAADALKGKLAEVAADLQVPLEKTIFVPSDATFLDVPKTTEELTADITAAYKKAIEDANEQMKKADIPTLTPPKVGGPADIDAPVLLGADSVMLLEDFDEAMAQLRTTQEEMLALGTPAVMDPETIEAGDEALKRLIESQAEMQASQELIQSTMAGVADSIGAAGSEALQAMLQGTNAAMRFGDMIKNVLIKAISDLIMKMLVVKALKMAFGIPFAEGGQVPAMALGGAIPRAAMGYAVPDGPRGMDSRLIWGMPGEEVINRSLSRRLDRMISAYEYGAAVSPFSLQGGGQRGPTVFQFNVGRPVSVLDGLSYGQTASEVSRKYQEAML